MDLPSKSGGTALKANKGDVTSAGKCTGTNKNSEQSIRSTQKYIAVLFFYIGRHFVLHLLYLKHTAKLKDACHTGLQSCVYFILCKLSFCCVCYFSAGLYLKNI
jgi:hypothetical protein